MTYTIITEDGTVMFREDLFTDEAEALAYIELEPNTPSGKKQHAVSTETAALITAEVKRLREQYERRLDIERRETVKRMLHNGRLS